MLTYPRTTPADFTAEGSIQILGGDQSRVWLQFTNPNFSQVGIDYVQQSAVADCAFVVQPFDNLILTKGDLGSILGAPMFATTGPPVAMIMWVTEILLQS